MPFTRRPECVVSQSSELTLQLRRSHPVFTRPQSARHLAQWIPARRLGLAASVPVPSRSRPPALKSNLVLIVCVYPGLRTLISAVQHRAVFVCAASTQLALAPTFRAIRPYVAH